MKKIVLFLFTSLSFLVTVKAQETNKSDSIKSMDNIVVIYNKWEQKINEVSNKIVKVDMKEARLRNPQTSADLLGMTGAVFIQKSQLGGGSPIIRGFATNRVLIVADGVRMNNAIYRSGNLQNVISIDPLSTENAEVIFGPGSLIYGSDAIGGVMDFHSLKPRYSSNNKMFVKGSALARYSTADKENTLHADLNLGWEKLSILSSVTYSKFDDLKMGKYTGPDSYLRPQYVQRINNFDSIVTNADPSIQRFSGYEQWNFLQKIAYKFNDRLELSYGFTYGGTGDAPRYDRLIQYRNGKLRYAEWYYGPMIWRMHTLQLADKHATSIYDESRIVAAYQDYDESRVDRTRGNNNQHLQSEKVNAYSINWDALKYLGKGELFYGVELLYNKVGSYGANTDISNGVITPYVTRYPNGSKTSAAGIYGSYKLNINEQFTFNAGLRLSYNTLDAPFDTSFIKFPYSQIKLNDGAPTGNIGLVYRPSESWQINANIATGYRMPNIDDIGKVFESVPGNITVPNPDLKSEYAWNFELGAAKRIAQKINVEVSVFYTILNNAIVRRPYTFNGEDSIYFDGILSRVEALQNVAKAEVYGVQATAELYLTRKLIWQINANWIKGVETDDVKDEQVPLRHAPPFYGNTNLRYTFKRLTAELSAFYNGEISADDMPPSEKAKTDIYAKDADGNPYCPSWYSVNLKFSVQLTKNVAVNLGWDNITNQRYRPYSSGIVAAGSNFIVSLRANL